MYDDGYIPIPSSVRLDEIQPVAAFISKKIVVLKNTLATSDDVDEKIETISSIALCQASISLLMIAYLTEDISFIEQAKHLYRGI
jgi:hypothetical protein